MRPMSFARRVSFGLTALATLSLAPRAFAQQKAEGFSLNRFEPAAAGSEWFAADSLDLRGMPRFAGGLVFDYGRKPLVVYDAAGKEVAPVVGDQFFAHVNLSTVLWDRLRVAASLPIALAQGGDGAQAGGTQFQSDNSTTVGDLRLGADVRLVGEYRKPITLALGGQLYFPTGSRDSYTGDGSVRGNFRALAAGEISS